MNIIKLRQFIREALNEDIGAGDLTTEALIPYEHKSEFFFIMKQPGIVSGLDIAGLVFQELDPTCQLTPFVSDGDELEKGTVIAKIVGPTRAILTGERVALNLMQRMSGITTLVGGLVKRLDGLNCKVLDTRKTTPGLRQLEKYAVRVGGGVNHRFGLSHSVMLKDNHIVICGSFAKAVNLVRKHIGHMVKVEVEVETLAQVKEVLSLDVDVILFDNMNVEMLREAVRMIDGKVLTEASGGITPENIRVIAETGVDFISLGWITHSSVALDISLDQVKEVTECY